MSLNYNELLQELAKTDAELSTALQDRNAAQTERARIGAARAAAVAEVKVHG